MELVEGKSLRMLSGEVGLPAESVLRYGVQIASALGRAHDKGIVHRDLKSTNIVVTSEGLVKVLDFGLAKRIGGGVSQATTWTLRISTGKIYGKRYPAIYGARGLASERAPIIAVIYGRSELFFMRRLVEVCHLADVLPLRSARPS